MDVFLAHCDGPWRRGVNDCYVAVADQINAWTGVDLMRGCRGFSNYTGMLRLIRKAGFKNPVEAMQTRLQDNGWQPVESDWQARDVTLIGFTEDGRKQVAPAVFADGFWHVRGKGGWLAFLDKDSCVTQAWRR